MSTRSETYQRRIIDDELDELLPELSAISLEGLKGVGKTATALERARTTWLLDEPDQLAIALAEPSRLVDGAPPTLIDEWQRMPQSWDLVRRAVDRNAPPGSYLLTGSATPAGVPKHSGAGRIVTIRMRPLSLAERGVGRPTVSLGSLLAGARPDVEGSTSVGLQTYVDEIVRSGFPGIRNLSDRAARRQLDGYIDRIVEHDFEEMGRRVRNPAVLLRWMTAYAAALSSTATFETIRAAATAGRSDKPARPTVQPYVDILERLWVLEPVLAWQPSRRPITRLGQAPKHQLADPALAARLVGIAQAGLLESTGLTVAQARDGPFLGALFESLVTQSVRVYAQRAEARVMHLRTRKPNEREIDLIVERLDRRVLAIEVKLAQSIDDADVRHLVWLGNKLGPDLLDAVIVTTGREAYRRPDGIAVIPAALLGP